MHLLPIRIKQLISHFSRSVRCFQSPWLTAPVSLSVCNAFWGINLFSALTLTITTPSYCRLFALLQGVDITSTWFESDTAINTISGTSMATPHVAGVAALYLSFNPLLTPGDVKDFMLSHAISGRISNVNDSPNLLVNTEQLFNTMLSQLPGSSSSARATIMDGSVMYATAIAILFALV